MSEQDVPQVPYERTAEQQHREDAERQGRTPVGQEQTDAGQESLVHTEERPAGQHPADPTATHGDVARERVVERDETATEPDLSERALRDRAAAAQEAAVRGEGSAASLVDNAQQDPDRA